MKKFGDHLWSGIISGCVYVDFGDYLGSGIISGRVQARFRRRTFYEPNLLKSLRPGTKAFTCGK